MTGRIGDDEGGRSTVVRREKVTDPRGRAWVNGELDSETWFAEVRKHAREQAQRVIDQRLREPQRPRRLSPS